MWLAVLLLLALAGCGAQKTRSTADLYEEARTLLRTQHYQNARAKAEAALRSAEPGSPWAWRLRLLRVEILQEQRETVLAREALDFQLPSGPQWTAERARYRMCQANLEYRQGRYKEALASLAEAQTLASSSNASGLLAEVELRRAAVAIRQGRFSDAEAGLRRLVQDAARRKDPFMQMKAKGNMGFLFMSAFRYEEAIPPFQETLAMARALGAADDEPRSLLNLGWCYYRLGDLDKAQHYYQDAEAGFERTGNRQDSQTCLGNIASIQYSRHQYGPAAADYLRALKIATELHARQSQAFWLNNLAKIAIETGDWNSAERYNNQAWALCKELPDHRLEAYSIANAGYIAAGRKDFRRAEPLFRSVVQAAPDDPVPLLNARSGLAHALAEQGKHRAAEAEYKAADAALEHQRSALLNDEHKLNYFSSLIEFYQDYIDYLMSRGRSREALEIAESSRARTLGDRLSLAHIRRGPGTAASFQRFAAAYGGVLLSYWLGPGSSYLWVITGARVTALPLPAEPAVRAMVEAYDALIQNARDPLSAENPAGRRLYDTLIAPAKALLPKNAKVILVPDGPLYALNFETLPVFDGAPHYWIEDARLAITPSLALLSLDRAPLGPAQRSLLLIGNPVSPVAEYPALEFAAQEMAGVEKSLAGFRQVVKNGAQAEPDAYLRGAPGGFGIIHFVAHAVANPKEPLESAVILSRQGTDYKLRAKDVLGTRLRASLVTISACRSAGARTYAGEGLVGLAWAFMEAGAKNVIAGLWDVNDRSTAELVSHLYAGLAAGAGPADALRAAKLELIHAASPFQKPYYWGPFELFTRQAR